MSTPSPHAPGSGRRLAGRTPVLAIAILWIAAAGLAAQHAFVQVRDTRLRAGPSYLSAAAATVSYGTRVDVVSERGPWREVATPGGDRGWLHASALGSQEVRMQSGREDVAAGADADEIALAGKGFNEAVEDAYRQDRRDLDFTWVDRMAAWRVSAEDAAVFLAAGAVIPQPGGDR